MWPEGPMTPDFRSPAFLREHIARTIGFYDGRCLDPSGGFFQSWRDDGTVLDARTRHLVGSTRFVITHAMALRALPGHPRAAAWREAIRHGLRFLHSAHHDRELGGSAGEGERHLVGRRRDGAVEVLDERVVLHHGRRGLGTEREAGRQVDGRRHDAHLRAVDHGHAALHDRVRQGAVILVAHRERGLPVG